MTIASRSCWNLLIAAVAVAGSVLIYATRVQPGLPAAAAATAAPPVAPLEPAPLPDHPAPDFRLTTADGTTLALSDLRGQVVLINIWATWCPPCRAEMPALQAAYEEYRERGFIVLAVNSREEAGAVTAFLAQHGLTFPAPLDADGAVSAAYRASVLPSSFFIDRRGVVRAVYRGPMARGVIDGTVEQLLQE